MVKMERLFVSAVAAVAALFDVGLAAAQSITRIEMPSGCDGANISDLSADGSAVVGSVIYQNGYEPFIWTACSGTRLITVPQAIRDSVYSVFPSSVSSDGAVVLLGGLSRGSIEELYWLYHVGTDRWEPLNPSIPFGQAQSWVYDMSDDATGFAVTSEDIQGKYLPQIWRKGQPPSPLGLGSGSQGLALGISGDGNRAWGYLYEFGEDSPIYSQLVLWTGGNPTVLQTQLDSDSYRSDFFYALSYDGSVAVGYSDGGYGFPRPFEACRWSPSGRQQLGVLSGSTWSTANDVDRSGNRVVGGCGLPVDPIGSSGIWTDAYLWEPESGMRSLGSVMNDLGVDMTGWALRSDQKISDDGTVIVGLGEYSGTPALFRVWLPRIIRKVDTLVDYNAFRHETEGYKPKVVDAQVVRRGSVIEMDVELFEPFTVNAANLRLEATHRFDRAPNSPPGSDPIATTIQIPMYESEVPPGAWGFVVLDQREGPIKDDDVGVVPVKTISIGVFSPVTAPVGEYVLELVAASGGISERRRLECNVVVIFNPMKQLPFVDQANVPLGIDRQEYVYKETGIIYYALRDGFGNFTFSQNSRAVLRGTLGLLEGLSAAERGNAFAVCRTLAAMINSDDDGGVLEKRWVDDPRAFNAWEGGRHPSTWESAEEIFNEYAASGPVKYGQCAAFAGTLAAATRSLGIASRPVTGRRIAHETPTQVPFQPPLYTHQIATCWFWVPERQLYGRYVSRIWPFHAWVEIRLNGEWNVIDATPQEPSDGLARLGPVRVSDIRTRNDYVHQDVAFMVSAIDADIWFQRGTPADGPEEPCSPVWNTTFIGQSIVTKDIAFQALDYGKEITSDYKNDVQRSTPFDPVSIVSADKVLAGESLDIVVKISNTESSASDYQASVKVSALNAQGEPFADLVPEQLLDLSVLPNSVGDISVSAPWSVISQMRAASTLILIHVDVERLGDGKGWQVDKQVVLGRMVPQLSSSAVSPVPVGTVLPVSVTWQNSSGAVIQSVQIVIRGDTGLTQADGRIEETHQIGPVASGQTLHIHRIFKAQQVGHRSISAVVKADGEPRADTVLDVVVSRCAGDFNEDTVVDDNDFLRFVVAYDLLDCRSRQMDPRCIADLNADGVVDDLDFQLFIVAYNQLVCL
jgi:uncharacterized membrane protein